MSKDSNAVGGNGIPPISITTKKIYTSEDEQYIELGKKLFTDSISTGAEFCKQMIGVSTGGIGLFLVLVAALLSKDYRPSLPNDIALYSLVIITGLFFIFAASSFIIGFQPRFSESVTITDPKTIKNLRTNIVKKRAKWSNIGLISFFCAIVLSIGTVIYVPTLQPPPAPTRVLILQKSGDIICGDLQKDAQGNLIINGNKVSDVVSVSIITTKCPSP